MATTKEIMVNGVATSVTEFDHSAQEIDDATERALEGGVIDQLLAGKAPAGYGLGNDYGSALPNGDFDQATKNGWYYIASDYPTNGPDGVPCWNAVLRVDRYSEIEQTLYLGTSGYQGCIMRRYYHTGLSAWQPWEWVNPRMAEGVEYRTTERYQGKPVYVKLVNFGAGANKAEKSVEHGASNAIVIDYGGYATSGNSALSVPWMSHSTLSVGSTTIVMTADADYSRYSVYVWIKYYKTTD